MHANVHGDETRGVIRCATCREPHFIDLQCDYCAGNVESVPLPERSSLPSLIVTWSSLRTDKTVSEDYF